MCDLLSPSLGGSIQNQCNSIIEIISAIRLISIYYLHDTKQHSIIVSQAVTPVKFAYHTIGCLLSFYSFFGGFLGAFIVNYESTRVANVDATWMQFGCDDIALLALRLDYTHIFFFGFISRLLNGILTFFSGLVGAYKCV